MKYEVRKSGEHAVIFDEDGKSIVNIVSRTDDWCDGRHYQTPVFEPDVAHRIVNALRLADAINGVVVTKPGIYL